MNALELNNIHYTYAKGTPFEKEALDGVSVSFAQGEITGLIGHTGSGKSTLVSMFNGLTKPAMGEVMLFGENIWAKPKEIHKVCFRVGLVMQYPEYQLFAETVEEDIAFGPKNMGLSPEDVNERVKKAADFVGIDEKMLKSSPFELSGGQKRRAAIAGVIAMQPEVLVLDEPAAGLDPRGRREILGGLCKYRDEFKATIILVSHSMEDMATYCDRVVVMNEGKVYRQGSVDEIFSYAEDLVSVGLDIPQIAHIAQALRQNGLPLEGNLYTVEGVYEAILALKGGDATC